MMQSKYSLEIQGLRGIAILAVMMFHFGGLSLPGGYVGVDVFFVISGYVITQLIVREHQAGSFTLGRFYKNRVVRLLPNLFCMIVATVLISYALLKPYDFLQFGKSLQFTSVYLTNMVFARQQGYFDLSREVKPLLHTWSLSIEEQFYLFFPLLLILLWHHHHSRRVIFAALLLVSVTWKIWLIQHDAIPSFFSFPGRIWEFMIGALSAQVPAAFRTRIAHNQVLSAISIVIVAITFVYLDERIPYAGLWVAFSCLATAVLILSSPGTLIGAGLSSKGLVFIGTISYSLYLWHWPLLVMLRNLDWNLTPMQQLPILVVATTAIAYAAWRYIEAPFHHNKDRYAGKYVGMATFAFAVFVIAVGGYIYGKAGMEDRFPRWVKVRQNLDSFDFDRAVGMKRSPLAGCKLSGDSAQNLSGCATFGDSRAEEQFLVIGDSHAAAWAPAFQVVAQRKNRFGIYSSLPGCPPILGVHSIDVDRNMCETGLEAKLDRLTVNYGHIKTAYLVAHWDMYANGNRINGALQNPTMLVSDSKTESFNAEQSKRVITKALERTIEFFNRRGIRVVIIYDIPALPKPIQELPDSYTVALGKYREQISFMVETVGKLRSSYQVSAANPGDVLCASGVCLTKLTSVRLKIEQI